MNGKRDGVTIITGATSLTYQLGQSEVGKVIIR